MTGCERCPNRNSHGERCDLLTGHDSFCVAREGSALFWPTRDLALIEARERIAALDLELAEERRKGAEVLAEALSDTAADLALNEIAVVCGCPEWEYPGQVVRDVFALKRDSELRERYRDERIERLEMALGRIAYADPDHPEVESWKWLAREFMGIARAALAREAQPVQGGEGK